MQKGRVVRLRGFGIIEYLQKNYFLIIILFFLILGIILGVFLFDNVEALNDYSSDYISEYIADRTDTSFLQILLSSALSSSTVLFMLFLLGASLFGVITVPAAVMLKGFFQGGVTAFLYTAYGLKGVAFNAIVFIPSTAIFIIVLILASRESIRFSIKISSLTINKTLPFDLSNDFRDYCIKYLIFMVATVLSSAVDAMVSVGLIKNFSL